MGADALRQVAVDGGAAPLDRLGPLRVDPIDASGAIRSPRRNRSALASRTTAAASMAPARGISGRTSMPASSPPVERIVLALARLEARTT